MTDDYVPKIALMPGSTLSPELVLNRTTAKLGRIKAVVVVIQWDDGTYDCDWSSMKTSELCMAKDVLHINALRVVEGDEC